MYWFIDSLMGPLLGTTTSMFVFLGGASSFSNLVASGSIETLYGSCRPPWRCSRDDGGAHQRELPVEPEHRADQRNDRKKVLPEIDYRGGDGVTDTVRIERKPERKRPECVFETQARSACMIRPNMRFWISATMY